MVWFYFCLVIRDWFAVKVDVVGTKVLGLMAFNYYVDLRSLMLRIWCFDGLLFDDMFVMWWWMFRSFPVRVIVGIRQNQLKNINIGKFNIGHQECLQILIVTSSIFFVLLFDSNFWIWLAFDIKRLIFLKLCINLKCGPSTCPFRCFECNKNGNPSCFGA